MVTSRVIMAVGVSVPVWALIRSHISGYSIHLLQSEKFDANGDYIRKWVPELKEVKGKAIHEPYARGAEAIARKAGYPRPIVEHKGARARALERYKDGLAGAKTDLAAVG